MALRILLVEDDLETLALMTEGLRTFEVEAVPLSDSEAAAALVNREKFDGIFLDLMMPKLDGYRLTKAIRISGFNRTTPIVIVTGSRERRVMQEAFQAGANFFLPKPVDRQRLAILLNTTRGAILANRRGLQRAPMQVPARREDTKLSPPFWTCNISERGILLEGDSMLRPGEELQLSFCLPMQKERITVHGVVARTDPRGQAGISFRTLRQTDRQRIRIYVAEELAKLKASDVEIAREIMA